MTMTISSDGDLLPDDLEYSLEVAEDRLTGHDGIRSLAAERGLKILLAEDDRALRDLLAAELRKDGHTVIPIADGWMLGGILAITLVNGSGAPRNVVVVSDVRMPGKDGLSVLREFRDRGWCPPFIMITAFGDRDVHREAADLGAAALFDKPFDTYDLRTAVLNAGAMRPLAMSAAQGHN